VKARWDDRKLVIESAAPKDYTQKQCGRIEARLLPSLYAGCHEGIPGMSIDEFIDEQGLKTVGVSVGGSKSQGGDERFGPLNFLALRWL
jgi:hypothetical protein